MKTFFLSLLAVSVLTACGTVMNSERDSISALERHPITVDQQTFAVQIPVDSTRRGLSRGATAQIDQFLTAYRTRGYGPVTVTAPSGAGRDIDAQQVAAEVRQSLNAMGLSYSDMEGASYRTDDRSAPVLLSFSRYVASGPECGTFRQETARRMKNLPSANFGCAYQSNLAAMVADPRDLTAAQTAAPSNGTTAAAAARTGTTGQVQWDTETFQGVPVGATAPLN